LRRGVRCKLPTSPHRLSPAFPKLPGHPGFLACLPPRQNENRHDPEHASALVAVGAPVHGGAAEPSAEPVFAVVSPLGESTVEMGAMAPRLDTLDGKTVCLVWNYAFKADVTLPAIGEALKQLYPNLTIIPHHAMPLAPLPDTPGAIGPESEALKEALLANRCDALIVGNGG